MGTMLGHIPFTTLADLVEGRLPAAERERSLQHVSDCARCAAQVAHLERIISLMRNDTSGNPPPAAVAYVLHLFSASDAARASAVPQGVRPLLATLRFDSNHLPAAHAKRNHHPASVRQLLFSTTEFDVDLRVASADGVWVVSGQLLGQCPDGGDVELRSATTGAVQSKMNELCEFTLPPVPAGSYTLSLRVSGLTMEAPGLEIG